MASCCRITAPMPAGGRIGRAPDMQRYTAFFWVSMPYPPSVFDACTDRVMVPQNRSSNSRSWNNT
eukprot:3357437-Rhodomonas_salina.1